MWTLLCGLYWRSVLSIISSLESWELFIFDFTGLSWTYSNTSTCDDNVHRKGEGHSSIMRQNDNSLCANFFLMLVRSRPVTKQSWLLLRRGNDSTASSLPCPALPCITLPCLALPACSWSYGSAASAKICEFTEKENDSACTGVKPSGGAFKPTVACSWLYGAIWDVKLLFVEKKPIVVTLCNHDPWG